MSFQESYCLYFYPCLYIFSLGSVSKLHYPLIKLISNSASFPELAIRAVALTYGGPTARAIKPLSLVDHAGLNSAPCDSHALTRQYLLKHGLSLAKNLTLISSQPTRTTLSGVHEIMYYTFINHTILRLQ